MPEKDISAQLPECYVPCDGSEITLGIWKGHRTADLNNAKRFLRGGSVSNALKIEEDSLQEHTHYHSLNDNGHTHGFTDRYVNKRGLDNKNGYWGPTEDDQGYDRWDHPHSKRTNSANSGFQTLLCLNQFNENYSK